MKFHKGTSQGGGRRGDVCPPTIKLKPFSFDF